MSHRTVRAILSGRLAIVMVAMVVPVARVPARAEPDPPKSSQDDTARAKDARLATMRRMVTHYELFSGAKEKRKAERSADPVLRWTNPERGASDGCLYLWTSVGRPEAIACFYPSFGGDGKAWDHEFQSLSRGPDLVAERDHIAVWTPERPGIELRPLRGAPVPADTPGRRLSQMRTIAGRFSATCIVRDDKSALRLMTTPIYRYGKA